MGPIFYFSRKPRFRLLFVGGLLRQNSFLLLKKIFSRNSTPRYVVYCHARWADSGSRGPSLPCVQDAQKTLQNFVQSDSLTSFL